MCSAQLDSIVPGITSPVVYAAGLEHGHSLESHRTYLKIMVQFLSSPALQAEMGVSDVVQSTLGSALRMMKDPDQPEIRNQRFWLCGILRNKICKSARKIARTRPTGSRPGTSDPRIEDIAQGGAGVERPVDDGEFFDWLMSKLPPEQRLIVEMRLLRCMEIHEIAEELGISVACANQRYQRARQYLQDNVDPRAY